MDGSIAPGGRIKALAHPLFPEPDARHDCEHSWRDAGDDEDDNDGVEDAEGGDDKAGNAGEHLKGHGVEKSGKP